MIDFLSRFFLSFFFFFFLPLSFFNCTSSSKVHALKFDLSALAFSQITAPAETSRVNSTTCVTCTRANTLR